MQDVFKACLVGWLTKLVCTDITQSSINFLDEGKNMSKIEQ